MDKNRETVINGNNFSIEDVLQVANGLSSVTLSNSGSWKDRVEKGAEFIKNSKEAEKRIYGISTGFGDSVSRHVPAELQNILQLNLERFHGCGLGKILSIPAARAVVFARLVSLARGYSGVRLKLLEGLCNFLNRDITPVIPQEGSVGASGDLTPLSYIAAALYGEREVFYKGNRVETPRALKKEGLKPVIPEPKETLALMNGTCVMTALACMAYDRASYLSDLSCKITAMASEALLANRGHFDSRIFEYKPFSGQTESASMIRDFIGMEPRINSEFSGRLQAPYSIRCAPHVIGVLKDGLIWQKEYIETELNSANDNPLIDPETGTFLHGGNFYGGHICFAMDSMKNATANVADLLDRQMALLVDTKFNNGLPPNLSGSEGERACVNHGLKALQIGVTSWTAEALKLTMPASVFSRSTECHNQDKVSLGTIASRDCLRIIELTEQVTAALLFAVSQAVEIRLRHGELDESDINGPIIDLKKRLLDEAGFLDEDRPLDKKLKNIITLIHKKEW